MNKINDLISRQAAIAHAVPLNLFGREVMMVSVSELENLPSAQPEPCGDVPDNNVGDMISRREAIKAICEHGTDLERRGIMVLAVANHKQVTVDLLETLPSAQPERKKGRWVYNSPVTMKCNQCGLVIKDWDWHRFKFCPNCEADMRGEQE